MTPEREGERERQSVNKVQWGQQIQIQCILNSVIVAVMVYQVLNNMNAHLQARTQTPHPIQTSFHDDDVAVFVEHHKPGHEELLGVRLNLELVRKVVQVSNPVTHTPAKSQPTHYPMFSSWQTHTSCQPTHYNVFSSWQTHTSWQPTCYIVFSSWQTPPAVSPNTNLCSVADKHTSAVSPHTTLCSVAVHRQDRNQTCTVQIHTDKTETRPILGRSTQARQETGNVPCTSTQVRQKTGAWMTYRLDRKLTCRSSQRQHSQPAELHRYWDSTKNWCVDRHKTDL